MSRGSLVAASGYEERFRVGRSVSLLKKTWGEALVGRLGLGFFLFLMFIPVIMVFAAGVFVMGKGSVAVGVALLIVGVIALLIH